MSGLSESIYKRMPVWIQNIGITAYGYKWHRRRFGGIFKEELIKFKERENFTTDQWRDYQTVELRKLLCHAFETVPYYNEKYKKFGFTISDFKKFELENLPKLPFLEKDDLRKYGTTTLLSTKREKSGQFFASSGSTGSPTQILFSEPFHQRWSAAFESRIRHWAGVDRFQSRGMIGGRRVIPQANASPPFYRYNQIEKQVYFSAYHISKQTVSDYLKGIKSFSVKYMTGYAMSNFFLAKKIEELGLKAPVLKAVITSSENLTKSMRQTFKRVFGCKSYDSYSGLEACGLISETKEGDLLISPDVGIMEIINKNEEAVNPGDAGEVISTGFLNYDQPLIRYKIGDKISLFKTQISISGINMPVVEKIEGRIEDKVIGKDGREMVRFHGLYIGIQDLIAAQIVQNDYDEFLFNIVTENGLTKENENIIKQRLESQLGPVKVEFNYIKEIPKNKNGKFQAVISNLMQN